MEVRFWGVRGSIAVSGAAYARAGGNTSCVEVRAGGERLILDGGTGLRALGDTLVDKEGRTQAIRTTLLFSHVHWDHIQGVPFFGPAFHPGSELLLVGATRDGVDLRGALARQMRAPNFPVDLDALRARVTYRAAATGEPFEVGPFRVTATDLSHPNGVLAWRVEAEGRAVVYATDTEHGGAIDPRLVALARGADLLVHDAQYTDEEYATRRGWGHSTWREAVEVARRAEVARLALFHHDPRRDDDTLAIVEDRARACLPGAFAAREGQAALL
jgi:phosphoribosyl 1,2-cyclic phosphodiesterase